MERKSLNNLKGGYPRIINVEFCENQPSDLKILFKANWWLNEWGIDRRTGMDDGHQMTTNAHLQHMAKVSKKRKTHILSTKWYIRVHTGKIV